MKIKQVVTILLIALLIPIIANSLTNKQSIDLQEPRFGTYTSDEYSYLKTFYLMKNGKNYYQAFKEANEGIAAGRTMTDSVFTWRWPTLFYFWQLLAKNGQSILALFWIMTCLSLLSTYYMLKKIMSPKYALIGPIILMPYFAANLLYKTSFLFTEWWAWFFYIYGLSLLINDKKLPAWIFLLLSLITRELMIIPITTLAILSLFNKKNTKLLISLFPIFMLLFFLHRQNVINAITLKSTIDLINDANTRLHTFNKQILLKMISFSMNYYPLINIKSHFMLVILSLIALIKNLISKNKSTLALFILIPGWITLLIFPFINTNQYVDYWGILFMSNILISTALLFNHSNSPVIK